jgi:hypothetical protein
MAGWTVKGNIPFQREKIYAILRANGNYMSTVQIRKVCHNSGDSVIEMIAIPTIRRCLQELRDHKPALVRWKRREPLPYHRGRPLNIPTFWQGINVDRNVE